MSKTSAARQLDIFAPAKPVLRRVPEIKIPAPSVPTRSSEDAADAINPFRSKSWSRILRVLSRANRSLSREEICERAVDDKGKPMRESSACARLSELCVWWIEAVPDACVSSSGISVNGYRLTSAGRALFTNGDATA